MSRADTPVTVVLPESERGIWGDAGRHEVPRDPRRECARPHPRRSTCGFGLCVLTRSVVGWERSARGGQGGRRPACRGPSDPGPQAWEGVRRVPRPVLPTGTVSAQGAHRGPLRGAEGTFGFGDASGPWWGQRDTKCHVAALMSLHVT